VGQQLAQFVQYRWLAQFVHCVTRFQFRHRLKEARMLLPNAARRTGLSRGFFAGVLSVSLSLAGRPAVAQFFNTNDPGIYATFATGATVQTFEAVPTLTPLALTSYTNAYAVPGSTTTVPASGQLGGQIGGLHFHSGGGSFNDPVGTPGTPTALLSLQGGIAGDAHSPTNVVGALDINTDVLKLDAFVEVIFTTVLQNRVGFWLNPALGAVTFTAFDSTGTSLLSGTGNAGNFVGIARPTDEIKFVSIVSQNTGVGFTIDDLTYGTAGTTTQVPEPSSLALLGVGTLSFLGCAWRRRKSTK
jgi:hypothetical protein